MMGASNRPSAVSRSNPETGHYKGQLPAISLKHHSGPSHDEGQLPTISLTLSILGKNFST